MALRRDVINVQDGVLTLGMKQLLTKCHSRLYDNLDLNDRLLKSMVSLLFAANILENQDKKSCESDPNTLLTKLSLRTEKQIEKFFLFYLQGEHGDEATIENREQLRSDFADVILRSILEKSSKQQLPIIHSICGHSDDFASCVTRILMEAPNKLENGIDYKRLSVPNQIKPPSTSNSMATLETGQSSTEIKTNTDKIYRSTFEVSQVLASECGTEFQGANNTLVEFLKNEKHKIRDDASANITFPNHPAWERSFNVGNMKSQEILKNILDHWVRHNGIETKIYYLIKILKEEGLTYAADVLESKYKSNEYFKL